MKFRAGAIALAAVLANTPALAWNEHGHMTVAAIAFERLDPSIREKVGALLKLNPQYETWTARVPAADRVEVAFIMAATWPDLIKRDESYQNDGSHNGNVAPTDPQGREDAVRNIGYADRLRHRYWHFTDVPFSPDGTRLVQPVPPNVQTQIAAFRAALRSPSVNADVKSYDLVWLEHLVGDVHQPLHATSRFTHDLPDGDDGGNRVALCADPCRGELHAFWDNVLGTSESLATIRSTAARLAAMPVDAGSGSEAAWVTESFEEAKRSVYVPPVGVGAGPFTLDGAYKTNAKQVAEKRIAIAGARLAALLNTALK